MKVGGVSKLGEAITVDYDGPCQTDATCCNMIGHQQMICVTGQTNMGYTDTVKLHRFTYTFLGCGGLDRSGGVMGC